MLAEAGEDRIAELHSRGDLEELRSTIFTAVLAAVLGVVVLPSVFGRRPARTPRVGRHRWSGRRRGARVAGALHRAGRGRADGGRCAHDRDGTRLKALYWKSGTSIHLPPTIADSWARMPGIVISTDR